jgi:hypothetical protein
LKPEAIWLFFTRATFCPGRPASFSSPSNCLRTRNREFELAGISLNYKADGKTASVALDQPFKVACVKDQRKATASIDKAVWEKKVIQEDYNRLRDDVAKDLKSGRKEEAMKKIDLVLPGAKHHQPDRDSRKKSARIWIAILKHLDKP